MAANDLIRLVVNQDLQSSGIQNVLYYKVVSDDTTDGNEVGLAQGFKQNVIDGQWAPVVSNSVTFTCFQSQKVFPLPVGAVRDVPINVDGTKLDESLPAMDAALIQKINTAVGGKGKKGRVYIAGWVEADQALGRLTASAFVELGIIATKMGQDITTPGGGDYTPVWAVRTPLTGVITGSVEITDFIALPRFATQRRRRTPVATPSS